MKKHLFTWSRPSHKVQKGLLVYTSRDTHVQKQQPVKPCCLLIYNVVRVGGGLCVFRHLLQSLSDYYSRCGPPFWHESELPVCQTRGLNPGRRSVVQLTVHSQKDYLSVCLNQHRAKHLVCMDTKNNLSTETKIQGHRSFPMTTTVFLLIWQLIQILLLSPINTSFYSRWSMCRFSRSIRF